MKFDGEDGSGPGVNRGFFASVANELKSSDVTKQPMNRLGQFFCQPGKKPEQSGLFAPCPFSKTGLSKGTKHLIMVSRLQYSQLVMLITVPHRRINVVLPCSISNIMILLSCVFSTTTNTSSSYIGYL